jgi:hypothetical protein
MLRSHLFLKEPNQECIEYKANKSRRGCGHGRNNCTALWLGRNANKTIRKLPRKSLSDYWYNVRSTKQASGYEWTTEYLVSHIHKSFTFGNDVGTALKELQPYYMDLHQPVWRTSTNEDHEQKEAEEKVYKLETKAEFDVFITRSWSKAYAFQ